MMQKVQRFGGALYVPVLLFPFAGVVIGITILFRNPLIIGSLADPQSLWYQCWFMQQLHQFQRIVGLIIPRWPLFLL